MDGAKIFWTAYNIFTVGTEAVANVMVQHGHPEFEEHANALKEHRERLIAWANAQDETVVDEDVPSSNVQLQQRQWESSNRLAYDAETYGYYVYSDRWWGIPFYYGKGKGKRMYSHVNKVLDVRDDSNEVKRAIILNMHNIGAPVEEVIERWFDSEKDAYAYEQDMIANCLYPLANIAGNYNKRIDMDYVHRVFANDKKAQEVVYAGLR